MREILFKGLLKTGKGWAFGNLRVDKKGCTIITPDETPLGIYGVVDPETVCQCTGLNDKNGVKIFEGDILSENGDLFTVVYDTNRAKFKLQYTHAIQYPEWNRGILMDIIGNIHDKEHNNG